MNFKNIRYKKAGPHDIDFLLELRKKTMSIHLINSGMDLNEEQHLDRIKYGFEYAKIIHFQNKRIGLLKAKEDNDNFEIIQFQIIPEFQNMGIGKFIINSIIEKYCSLNLKINLSVLKKNKAKYLYQKMGFAIIKENQFSYQMELINTFKTNVAKIV